MSDAFAGTSVLSAEPRRYNRFFASVISAVTVLVAAMIAATYIVDPYAEAPDADGIYFASSPASVRHYRDWLSRGPAVLVFGTSRSQLFSDRFIGEPVINLEPLYGWPKAVLAFLEGLDEPRLRNVRRIIYLLDYHTMARPNDDDLYYPTTSLQRLAFRLRNLRGYTLRSITRVNFLMRGGYRFHIDPRGFTVQDQPARFDGVQRGSVENQSFDETEVARLADIKAFGKKHGIAIEFITPVLPDSRLKVLNRDLLFAQRRAFVRVLGSYFELTTIAGISDRPEMFADTSHINADGMQELFARYPWRDRVATSENIEMFLDAMAKAASR